MSDPDPAVQDDRDNLDPFWAMVKEKCHDLRPQSRLQIALAFTALQRLGGGTLVLQFPGTKTPPEATYVGARTQFSLTLHG